MALKELVNRINRLGLLDDCAVGLKPQRWVSLAVLHSWFANHRYAPTAPLEEDLGV